MLHYYLLHLTSKSPLPFCSLCRHYPLTIDHHLLSRPEPDATRIEIQNYLPPNIYPLSFDYPKVITEILNIFKHVNLKI